MWKRRVWREISTLEKQNLAFGYAGDAFADRPIFEASQLPIVVGGRAARAGKQADKAVVIPQKTSTAPGWWKSLRPHQWSKNVLLFAPALAAHRIDRLWPNGFLAFWAFSLVASAFYLLNDFSDIVIIMESLFLPVVGNAGLQTAQEHVASVAGLSVLSTGIIVRTFECPVGNLAAERLRIPVAVNLQ